MREAEQIAPADALMLDRHCANDASECFQQLAEIVQKVPPQ